MSSTVTISASYIMVATGVVDLSPKAWGDVKDWYIKWDTLHVQFEGEVDWKMIPINSDTEGGVDWKRPSSVDVFSGALEFEEELASS
jgi:hypothetical protein